MCCSHQHADPRPTYGHNTHTHTAHTRRTSCVDSDVDAARPTGETRHANRMGTLQSPMGPSPQLFAATMQHRYHDVGFRSTSVCDSSRPSFTDCITDAPVHHDARHARARRGSSCAQQRHREKPQGKRYVDAPSTARSSPCSSTSLYRTRNQPMGASYMSSSFSFHSKCTLQCVGFDSVGGAGGTAVDTAPHGAPSHMSDGSAHTRRSSGSRREHAPEGDPRVRAKADGGDSGPLPTALQART